MFELAPNTPASVNLFTCPIKPLKDFLFSIPSKDGEENTSKNSSFRWKEIPVACSVYVLFHLLYSFPYVFWFIMIIPGKISFR